MNRARQALACPGQLRQRAPITDIDDHQIVSVQMPRQPAGATIKGSAASVIAPLLPESRHEG